MSNIFVHVIFGILFLLIFVIGILGIYSEIVYHLNKKKKVMTISGNTKPLTVSQINNAVQKLCKVNLKFYKEIGQLYGIKILVDDTLPLDHWEIRCGRKFYECINAERKK